jgi:hypothetical protein
MLIPRGAERGALLGMSLLIVLAVIGLFGSGDASAQASDTGWRELTWTALPATRPYPRAFILPFDFAEFYAGATVSNRRDASTINTMRDRATGQGAELSLKLDESKTITFVDCASSQPGCPLGMFHLLVAWWPQHQAYVVVVGGAGWGEGYIVSAKDGQMVVVGGNPVLSPSGRYAVAQNHGGDPPSKTSLEVIDLGLDPPRSIDSGFKSACPNRVLREGSVWLDDTSVTFEDSDPKDEPHPVLRIADGKLDWRC